MKLGAPLAVGLFAGFVAWHGVMQGLGPALAHISALMGRSGYGGDIEGPIIALLGGALYALGLGLVIVAAIIEGLNARRLVLSFGAIASALAEWMFASYIVAKRRLISPEYDRLPGPQPVQLADDTTILWHIAAVTAAHVLLVVAATAIVFLVTRAVAKAGSLEASQQGDPK